MNRCKRNVARVISLVPVFLAVGAVAAVTGTWSSSQTETYSSDLAADGDTQSIGDHYYPTTGNHPSSGNIHYVGNHQPPSTGNHLPPSTGNHQPPSTGNHLPPSTGNHLPPSTGNHGPGGPTPPGCEGNHTPTNHCGGTDEKEQEEENTPDQAGNVPSTSTSSGQTSASVPAGSADRKKRGSSKKPTDSKKRNPEDDNTPSDAAGGTGAGNSVFESPGLGSTDPLLVLTSPKLNDAKVHRVSRKALLRRMVIGYKGYIKGAADPANLEASLLRREGDRCYLPDPAGKPADCNAFDGGGRLHLLRSSGKLRFAYRPLATAEGSHSAQVKRAIQLLRSDGGVRQGTYELRFRLRSTDGSSHVYKYLFEAG